MGVVNTTYTFLGTDTITSAKLNNIIDDTTFTGDAIQGTTLQVVSPGKLAVSAGGITSNELASGSVTPAKISTGGPSWTASSVSLPSNTSVSGTVTATGFVGPLTGNVTGNVTGSAVTSGTAVTASGSTVTFTSIPSWVSKITLLFEKLSTNGTSIVYVRVGSGGTLSSLGYDVWRSVVASNASCDAYDDTIGVAIDGTAAVAERTGSITFTKLGSSNKWIISGNTMRIQTGSFAIAAGHAGSVTLSGQLNIIGIDCAANSFDAGTVNVIYQ
jgi:hypothetical protein